MDKNLWLVFGLLSAFFASLVSIFGKIGLRNVDANTATAIRSVIMAVFIIIVVAFQGKLTDIPSVLSDKKATLFIVLSGLAGAMSWLCYFFAIKSGDVSKVVPIDKLSVVFAVVLAITFLGEKISLTALIGIASIAVGAVLVAVG